MQKIILSLIKLSVRYFTCTLKIWYEKSLKFLVINFSVLKFFCTLKIVRLVSVRDFLVRKLYLSKQFAFFRFAMYLSHFSGVNDCWYQFIALIKLIVYLEVFFSAVFFKISPNYFYWISIGLSRDLGGDFSHSYGVFSFCYLDMVGFA